MSIRKSKILKVFDRNLYSPIAEMYSWTAEAFTRTAESHSRTTVDYSPTAEILQPNCGRNNAEQCFRRLIDELLEMSVFCNQPYR
jgi:hypothetical protein